MMKLRQRFKSWWANHRPPYMTRREHLQSLNEQYLALTRTHTEEERRQAIVLDTLIPKLIKITVSRLPSYGTYRCSVDFDTEFVYNAFSHGNSQEQIRYVAAYLSRMIEREILTINFSRFDRGETLQRFPVDCR